MYLPAVLVRKGETVEARQIVEALEKAASERYVWPWPGRSRWPR